MRIIYKKPSDMAGGRPGVCACDIVSFRHHPSDTDPCLVISRADGWVLTITQAGRDNGTLDRIVEALLSPSGVADCRNARSLSFDLKRHPTHVLIDDLWAKSVVARHNESGEHYCLVTAPIR